MENRITYKGAIYKKANKGKGGGTPIGQMPQVPVGERKKSLGNSKLIPAPAKHPTIKYHQGK